MLDDATRIEIAKSMEDLSAQDAWQMGVWQRSYDLACANENRDDLVKCAVGGLFHYFASATDNRDLDPDRQTLRDLAAALRLRMSAADYMKKFE